MKKAKKPGYSVAMSKDTGCIVMVRTNGKATVIGSLTKEDSDAFARGVLAWLPQMDATGPLTEPHPRLPYNH